MSEQATIPSAETEEAVTEGSAPEAALANADPGPEGEEPFDAPVRTVPAEDPEDALVVSLDGYAGPLDLLLDLARKQKVDLRKISMLALVEQYLVFVEAAKQRKLELAADYLVMAAWLTFLKSKLLLPTVDTAEGEPTADEMAARLAFQLQRLEAMRNASAALFKLPQLGVDFAPRGAPEGVRVVKTQEWRADLFDLLQAYAKQRIANIERHYKLDPPKVYTVEEARERLARILGALPEWTDLRLLAPEHDIDAPRASVIASAFNAALEFAKDGKVELMQLGHYEPLYLRQRATPRQEDADGVSARNDEADAETSRNVTALNPASAPPPSMADPEQDDGVGDKETQSPQTNDDDIEMDDGDRQIGGPASPQKMRG